MQNPNDAELPVDGLAFEVEINGQPFARGVADRAVVIPRFGEGVIELAATSTLGSFFRQWRELQKGERRRLDYRIRGSLRSGPFGTLPFDRKGELDLAPFLSPSEPPVTPPSAAPPDALPGRI